MVFIHSLPVNTPCFFQLAQHETLFEYNHLHFELEHVSTFLGLVWVKTHSKPKTIANYLFDFSC
jgi:hypothetical protein